MFLMPSVSVGRKTFGELETFYKAEIGLTVKMQREKPLDYFIEEMAMLGLEKYRTSCQKAKNNG